MKNQFSIIYLQTNSASNEKFAVGIVAVNEKKEVFVNAAYNKFNTIKKLVGDEIVKQAQNSLDLIKKTAEKKTAAYDKTLFKEESLLFSKEHLTYLSKYSKGLLQFDAPKSYAEELDFNAFKTIFSQFIEKWPAQVVKEKSSKSFHKLLRQRTNTLIFKEKADINYKLTPEILPGLLLPQDVTIISKNGSILAAQAVDFTTGVDVIAQHAYETELMITYLDKFANEHKPKLKKGSYTLLFNKPQKKSPQEKLLNQIKNSKSSLMKIEEIDYLEVIENQLKQKNYSKFSENFE